MPEQSSVAPVQDVKPIASVSSESIGMEELAKQLKELNAHLARKTSLRFMFAVAILQGLGYLLGATFVASLVVAVLVRFLSTLNVPAMLNGLIGSIELPGLTQQLDPRRYQLQ